MEPNVYAPSGWPIQGTKETLRAIGEVNFSVEEGELVWYFNGSTDVRWDEQVTEKENGEVIFVDKAGGEWTKSELISDPTFALVDVVDQERRLHKVDVDLSDVKSDSPGRVDFRDVKSHVREELELEHGDRFEDPQEDWDIQFVEEL